MSREYFSCLYRHKGVERFLISIQAMERDAIKLNLKVYVFSAMLTGCSSGKFSAKERESPSQAISLTLNSVYLGDLPLNNSGVSKLSEMISSAKPAQSHELEPIQKFGFVEDYTITLRGQSKKLLFWHGPVLLAENGGYYISVSAGQLWRRLIEVEMGDGNDDGKRKVIERILNEIR